MIGELAPRIEDAFRQRQVLDVAVQSCLAHQLRPLLTVPPRDVIAIIEAHRRVETAAGIEIDVVSHQGQHRLIDWRSNGRPRSAIPAREIAARGAVGCHKVTAGVKLALVERQGEDADADGGRNAGLGRQAPAQRPPTGAIPHGHLLGGLAAGLRETAADIDLGAIHGDRVHGAVHRAIQAQLAPRRARPPGDVVGAGRAGQCEIAAGEQVAIRAAAEREDLFVQPAFHAAGHGLPGGPVPGRHTARRHAAHGVESAADIEFPGVPLYCFHRAVGLRHPLAHGRPGHAVPSRDGAGASDGIE